MGIATLVLNIIQSIHELKNTSFFSIRSLDNYEGIVLLNQQHHKWYIAQKTTQKKIK